MENQSKNRVFKTENTYTLIAVLLFIAIIIFVVVVAIIASNEKAYQKGKAEGMSIGYGLALDTVQSIMSETAANQSKVSKVTIASKDTNTYYLSKVLATQPTYKRTKQKTDERLW